AKTIDYESELQVSSQATNICISEVVSNGGQSGSAEWIELYNPIGHDLNLSGWEIDDGNYNRSLPSITIQGYEVITLGDDDANTDFNITISLKDDGDWVLLRNSTGDVVDAVLYGSDLDEDVHKNTYYWNSNDTVAAPSDSGESIQRYNLTKAQGLEDNNLPSDWFTSSPTPGALPQYNPDTPGSALITEIMINPNGTDSDFEYIEIYNTLNSDLNVGNWSLWNSDDWTSGEDTRFPSDLIIPANSYLVVMRDASAWSGEYGFSGLNCSGDFTLPNSAPKDIILTDPFKTIIDRVAYRSSDPFVETIDNSSWNGDGIYIGSSAEEDIALTRLYNPNQNDEYVDTNSSQDWRYDTVPSLGKHSNSSLFLSSSISENATVTAFSSPDNSFNALTQLFGSAQHNLDICVYQFTSYWILQEVLAALDRGVHVRLLLEGIYPGASLENGGTDEANEVVYVANHVNGHENGTVRLVSGKFLNYYHSKYFLIDNETVLISTENFKYTGIPKDSSAGNRGWGIAVNNTDITAKYLNVYNFDWNLAQNYSDFDVVSPKKNDEILEGNYEPLFEEPQTYNTINATFQTVVGPDETIQVVVDLINQAQDSIYAELFYLYPTWPYYYGGQNNNPLMHALIDAADRGVSVKVILDSTWYNLEGDNNNDEAAAILKSHGVQIKYSNNSGGIEKFHVKALIVDKEAVLISSLNWNENSATRNREIGIIVNSTEVASYYVQLFNYDWGGYSVSNPGEPEDENGFLETTTWLFWLPVASVLYVGILGFGYSIRRRKRKIQKKKEFARDRLREKKAVKTEPPKKEKPVDINDIRQSVHEMYGEKVRVPHLNEEGEPLDDIEPSEFVRNYIKHSHQLIEKGKYLTPIDRVAILKYRENRYIAFDAERDLQSLLSTEYLKQRVRELEQRLRQKDNKMDSYVSQIGEIEKETENIKAQEDHGNLADALAEQERKIQELKDKMFKIQKEKKALKEEMENISEDQKSPLNELVKDLQTKITKQKLLIKKLKQKEEKDDPYTFESSAGENK
ncbi:MAG: phospholipase D-like domain-containing protein, partial [Promethearchaeia archaeon]